MSPSESQLRAALREGSRTGVDAGVIIANAERQRRARRQRINYAAAAVVAAAFVGVGGTLLATLGSGDEQGGGSAAEHAPRAGLRPAGSSAAASSPRERRGRGRGPRTGSRGLPAGAGEDRRRAPHGPVGCCRRTSRRSPRAATRRADGTVRSVVLTGSQARSVAAALNGAAPAPATHAGRCAAAADHIAVLAGDAHGRRVTPVLGHRELRARRRHQRHGDAIPGDVPARAEPARPVTADSASGPRERRVVVAGGRTSALIMGKVVCGSRSRSERRKVCPVRRQQLVEQRYGDVPLPYQGIGQQGAQRHRAVAGARGFDGEHLVGRNRLDEPEELRSERRHLDRMRAGAVDVGGHLDHRLVRQPGDRAVVADVHVVVRAVAGQQRRDQRSSGLAVVGAAALLEQLGLVVERGIAVHLEQGALDLEHLGRAMGSGQLFVDRFVGAVEVVQVVGGDGPHRPQQLGGLVDLVGQRGEFGRRVEQLGQPVGAVHEHPPDPGQMVQAGVVEADPVGLDAQPGCDPALEPDRDVAQAEGAVAGVEQGPSHDADRVGEVDDPRLRFGPLGDHVGDLQHDRHCAQRLGEAARAGGLLPEQPELAGQRLVHQPGLLAADAQLDEHGGRSVDGVLQRGGRA